MGEDFDEITLTISKEFTKRMLLLVRADLEILKTLATSIDPTKLDIFTWATLERIHEVNTCVLANVKTFYESMASKKAGNDVVYMIDDNGFPGWRERAYFEAKKNGKNPIAT